MLSRLTWAVSKTETATDAFNSNNPRVHQLIMQAVPRLLDKKRVQQLGAGLLSEVAANYRASSLFKTDHAPGSLQGGDRVPDLDVTAQEGDAPRPARLHELLDPSRFTLLTTGIAENAKSPLTAWGALLQTRRIAPPVNQTEGKALSESCFGAAPGLFLVRPDSYLGFAGRENGWPALTQWLEHWLPAAGMQGEEDQARRRGSRQNRGKPGSSLVFLIASGYLASANPFQQKAALRWSAAFSFKPFISES